MANRITGVFAVVALFICATPALSSPIDSGTTYRLLHMTDANLFPSPYALRLDGLDGDASHDFMFSAESDGAFLTILYDATADNLTLSGTVFGGHRVGDTPTSAPSCGNTISSTTV